jgi:hypothetical protein
VQGDHGATIAPAYALLPTKAKQIELAPFSLTKPRQVLSQRKNFKRQTQALVAFNAPASTGEVAVTILRQWEAASYQNARSNTSMISEN